MEITLYNLEGTKLDLYLKKLDELEATVDFISKHYGNTNRAVIKVTGNINEDAFHEIEDNLIKQGFYIFPNDGIYKATSNNSNFVERYLEITLDRNLLIVGNGFDLAHNMQTSYIDFFNNCSKKDNLLFNYLKSRIHYNKLSNIRWIDIEAEISFIIHHIECMRFFFKENKYSQKINFMDKYPSNEYFYNLFNPFKNGIYFSEEEYINSISNLEKNLDSLITMLENYLSTIEYHISSMKEDISVINNIKNSITHILSFNYTDTFRLHYSKLNDENIDFIHGKLGKHDLVLGISETLDKDIASIELSCIYFKKYFQRIFKHTGAKYKSWLNNNNKYDKFQNVYIYGHSLDETDRDILRDIINSDRVKHIIIYHHNISSYRSQIANLVKILGKDTMLKYTYGANPKIEFVSTEITK